MSSKFEAATIKYVGLRAVPSEVAPNTEVVKMSSITAATPFDVETCIAQDKVSMACRR